MRPLSWGMWDLVPWPGIEPGPLALEAWSLSHWTIREVQLPGPHGPPARFLYISIGSSLVTQTVKASAYNAGYPGSITGSGKSPGEGNGNSLQYSCLENPMDWWNFGFLFPGCHGQLCVPSTDVPAVSTCRHGSSLQAPCPELLLGLHRQGMTDSPYSWSQALTSLEVQLILHDQNPHPESYHSCDPKFLL